MNSETLTYLRIGLSVVAIAFGLWQYFQRRSTEKLIALEAIELHKNIAFALGATQDAKQAIQNGTSPALDVGRAEGLSQAVLYESAKLYCNLKKTTIDDIDDLISNGQILPNYRNIYYAFSDRKRGWIRDKLKSIGKLF